MKFNVTLLATVLTALTFAAPACDKPAEEPKKEEAGDKAKEEPKKEEPKKEEPKKEEPKAETAAADSTGIPECDEVMKRTKCTFDKIPDAAMRKQAEDGFAQMSAAWKGVPEAAKQATADGCKQALEAGKAGWEAQGC